MPVLVGCLADSDSDEGSPPKGYDHYQSDGVSLYHPSHWVIDFDTSSGLYSAREIRFEVSEFSGFGLLVFEEEGDASVETVMDRFVAELGLPRDPLIADFTRKAVEMSGFEGEKITWSDSFVEKSDFEMTVLKVKEGEEEAFAFFILNDADIQANDKHKIDVVKSITFD
ncbi:hypothetical protein [Marinimicrobium locisalis]|uniref:hypothetical protein n=1 Tax=Marinimicrobium locisalis TaxID=546022 RepID=UPI0032216C98